MVALVLLPGMDGTAVLLTEFAASFGQGVNVISVSYPTDRVLGYAELTQIARESLSPDEPFVLLGESFSGPIAISLAASAPPGLLGLVLCCTFARSPLRLSSVVRQVLRMLPACAIPQSLLGFFCWGGFHPRPCVQR
jgi:pimeloyl-[acyl-carrier protein] methyl ester esterase